MVEIYIILIKNLMYKYLRFKNINVKKTLNKYQAQKH